MHVTTLIELAVQRLDRKSVRALAERIGVSSGVLSEWRTGQKPIPDERIRQIAQVAGQDAAPWVLLIKSEQEEGELGRMWGKLAKQLGATVVLLVLCAMPFLTFAATSKTSGVERVQSVYYVKYRTRVLASIPTQPTPQPTSQR